MLKWTVHKRTEQTGSGEAGTKLLLLAPQSNDNQRLHSRRSLGNLTRPIRTAARERQRKSLGSSEISKRIQNRDKENQLVHTPHPYGYRQNVTSTPVIAFGTKLEYALRDVRNITPKQQQNTNAITSIINAVTPSRKRPLAKTPPSSPSQPTQKIDTVICSSPKQHPNTAVISATPYASTLPTFDIEYSPCGASQPILQPNAMNSITVTTDSLFSQQRYFQEPLPASKRLKFSPTGMTPLSTRLSELRFSKLNFCQTSLHNGSAKKQAKRKAIDKGEPIVSNATVETNLEKVNKGVDISNNVNNNNDINKNNNNEDNLYKKPFAVSENQAVKSSESTLSSSALDDTALDKMIDAILESARKEPKPSLVRNLAPRKMHLALSSNFTQMSSDSPTYTAAEDPASDLNKFCDNFQISPDKLVGERTIILEEPTAFNEREVRTPEPLDIKRSKKCENVRDTTKKTLPNSCHLRRQRAVRRKHTKCDQNQQSTQATQPKQEEEKQLAQSEQQSESTASNEQSSDCSKPESSNFSSPKTPSDSDFVMSSFFKKNADELANMNTPVIDMDSNSTYAQQPNYGITSITSKISSYSTPGIHTNDLQASSTPTNTDTIKSIRRCLTFSDSPSGRSSSTTTDDDSLEKLKSTVSMVSTSTLSNSARASSAVSGSLDLSMICENNKINIHGESLV